MNPIDDDLDDDDDDCAECPEDDPEVLAIMDAVYPRRILDAYDEDGDELIDDE